MTPSTPSSPLLPSALPASSDVPPYPMLSNRSTIKISKKPGLASRTRSIKSAARAALIFPWAERRTSSGVASASVSIISFGSPTDVSRVLFWNSRNSSNCSKPQCTELKDKGLLRLMHDEQAAIGDNADQDDDHAADSKDGFFLLAGSYGAFAQLRQWQIRDDALTSHTGIDDDLFGSLEDVLHAFQEDPPFRHLFGHLV